MKKYNKYDLAMRMKYGNNYDAPLYKKASDPSPKPKIPKIIDDATEEKAAVYDNLNAEEQREKVLEIIKNLGSATDNEIARILRINPSTVSARRNELRDRGLIIPKLDAEGKKAKKVDSITGVLNTIWKPVDEIKLAI